MEPANTESIIACAKSYFETYLELYNVRQYPGLRLEKAMDRAYELTRLQPWLVLKERIGDAVTFHTGQANVYSDGDILYISYYIACKFMYFLMGDVRQPMEYKRFTVALEPCTLDANLYDNFMDQICNWKNGRHIRLATLNATEIEALQYRFADCFVTKIGQFDMRKCVADACDQVRIGTVIDTALLRELIG